MASKCCCLSFRYLTKHSVTYKNVNKFLNFSAVIVNLTKEAATNPDYEVEPKIFEEWEKKNGKVPEGAIVLLSFNWTAKYNSKTEYLGSKDLANNQTYHFPGLSPAGAQWLVTRNVYGVGTDTASIDPGKSKVR